jgi:alpha-amylase
MRHHRFASTCRHLLAPLASLSLLASLAAAAAGPAPAIDIRPVPVDPAALKSPLPAHWQRGVFMEIFVRAWRDSDGDGIGDLRGLKDSLPYLQRLGVRGLWLMPITKNADGDHGYATTDFRDIAPEYGTLADFDAFIAEAHRRGIGVIMDYVINHSAAQHPMFVDALRGPASPFHGWYVWADEAPQGWDIWGKNPWYLTETRPWTWAGDPKDIPSPPPGARGFYFGTFGPHMPDFNFRNPDVLRYHQDSLRFWLNRGLDGFRLDAVPHLLEGDAVNWNDQPESRALTKQLQDLIKAYPQRYVVCEATAEPQAYGDPAVCGGAFAFGFVHHHIEAARGKADSVQRVAEFWRTASPTMASFLSNHDIFAGRRVMDQLQGDERRYRLAAAGYLLQPGTPFIYYGEEVGMAGVPLERFAIGSSADLPIRGPMSWRPDVQRAGFTRGVPFRPIAPNVLTHNAQTQAADPASLLNFYRAMIGLRNTWPSIARGSFEASFHQGLIAGWQRRLGRERTGVVINYGEQPAQVDVPGLAAGERLQLLWPRPGPAKGQTSIRAATVSLPAQSLAVYRILAPAGRPRGPGGAP